MSHPIQRWKAPTIADVARSAGVTAATVSYVLGGRRADHGASRISDATGYRVNEPARTLRRNCTDRILLLMDRLSSPHEQHLASVIASVLAGSNRTLSIVVCTTLDRLDNALGMVRAGLADGAIVPCRDVAGQQALLESQARARVPMVVVSSHTQPAGFDIMRNDERPAIEAAVDHLDTADVSGDRRIVLPWEFLPRRSS